MIDFKKDQVYKYSQDEWSVIGVVISVSSAQVRFTDLVIEGEVDKMERWDQSLPLSFKSPRYKLLGNKDDFPELFL